MSDFAGTIDMERRQARTIRWMTVLSILFHFGTVLVGSAVAPLFPSQVFERVMTVEILDAPMSTLPPEEAPVRLSPAKAPDRPVMPTESKIPVRNPRSDAARKFLSRIDSSLAEIPEAPVRRGKGNTGGIPVRHWVNEGGSRPGDFRPAIAPEIDQKLRKHLDELEGKVQSSARRGIATGREVEAAVMFGGVGSSEGEPVPPWIQEMIRKRVRSYLSELESAYSAAYRRNPELKGQLVIRFRIEPSGRIQRVDPVQASFNDKPFVAKVVDKVRAWTFDPIDGRTVDVLYPFVFVAPT